jgi:pyruvate decarboxylase
MIRYELNPIILLINNGGYTIEVEIHDGPYNIINNWDYCGLCRAFDNGKGHVLTQRVTKAGELIAALAEAQANPDK